MYASNALITSLVLRVFMDGGSPSGDPTPRLSPYPIKNLQVGMLRKLFFILVVLAVG